MCSVDVRKSEYHAAKYRTRTYDTFGAGAARAFSFGISEAVGAHDY